LEVGKPPFLALLVLINPVNEVLIRDPRFLLRTQRLIGRGTPVFMLLLEKNGFKIEEENVMSQITRNSRMMSVNSPNNPARGGLITW